MQLNDSNKTINFIKKRRNKGEIGNSNCILLETTSATYFLPCAILNKAWSIYMLYQLFYAWSF